MLTLVAFQGIIRKTREMEDQRVEIGVRSLMADPVYVSVSQCK